jgi:hypothetical protein
MCNADWDRANAINDFIAWCNQPYDANQIQISRGRADEIAVKYFEPLRQLPDESVQQVLEQMRRSIIAPPDEHRRRRWENVLPQWKGCCVGFADYLLRPRRLDGLERMECARALQRFSGWYHTDNPLFNVFQPVANSIGNMIFGTNVLRYLKIGEEWTFELTRVDPAKINDGHINFWDFAAGVPNEIRTEAKLEAETRILASRLLCFVCQQGYTPRISTRDRDDIVALFPDNDVQHLPRDEHARNRHPLLRWSIGSPFVDMLTSRIKANINDLLAFLQRMEFSPDITHNPGGLRRLEWFKQWEVQAEDLEEENP